MRHHPVNFRTNSFFLFGKKISIAAMAGPHNNTANHSLEDEFGVRWSLQYLKKTGIEVIIGLHEAKNYTEEAEELGLEYHFLLIEDYMELDKSLHKPIPCDNYDNIYELLKKATQVGKKVCIHCGSGNGRTGTALAALKLRELLEKECELNPSILDEVAQINAVISQDAPAEEILCASDYVMQLNDPLNEDTDSNSPLMGTPLVKKAIKAIRQQYVSPTDEDCAKGSVETQNDVDTLIHYESHLKRQMKLERGLEPFLELCVLPMDGKEEKHDALVLPKETQPTFSYSLFAEELFGSCLYAGSHPTRESFHAKKNLMQLKNLGIKTIYSLEKKSSCDITFLWRNLGLHLRHETENEDISYFIDDLQPPSVKQLDTLSTSILRSMERHEPIYLHCTQGLGRTGTVLAAIYMKKVNAASAQEAMDFVRQHYNALAIETEEQESVLEVFFQSLQGANEESFFTVPAVVEKFTPENEAEHLKRLFFLEYNKKLLLDKQSHFFGTIKSEVKEKWSLVQILRHALKHPKSRSRDICEKQEWLHSNGSWHDKAPMVIREMVEKIKVDDDLSKSCALM